MKKWMSWMLVFVIAYLLLGPMELWAKPTSETAEVSVEENSVAFKDVSMMAGKYGAALAGTMNYTGTRPTSWGFIWGRSEEKLDRIVTDQVVGTANPYTISWGLVNLEHGMRYYYRLFAVVDGKTILDTKTYDFNTRLDSVEVTLQEETECGYLVAIAAGEEVYFYETATSKKTVGLLEPRSSSYTIFCTKHAVLSDGSERYYFTDANGTSRYLRFYPNMGSYYPMVAQRIHNYTETVVESTCISLGYTKYICTCGDQYQEAHTEKGEHAWSTWALTESGFWARTCGLCKETQQVQAPIELTFQDVRVNSYCYDAIQWALLEEITKGVSVTRFAPDDECTRGHVITFLWRAAGSPEPKSMTHNFQDLDSKAFYYKAVLWAVENGITKGTTATTFAPGETCTRGHVVTFLYRFLGEPDAKSAEHPFLDVKEGTFYYKPMLWAVENGITKGTTPTSFGPDAICTRGQIITFLYRAMN